MNLVITVAATENYCYAMKALARRVTANFVAAKWTDKVTAIIAGDMSRPVKDAVNEWRDILPPGSDVIHISAVRNASESANYKPEAQILVARLRGAAFAKARALGAELCWSLDSDTLPPANALRCMVHMLKFDSGFYGVSFCPYPGAAFLGGRGTPQNPISEDYIETERVLTDTVKTQKEELQKLIDVENTAAKEAGKPVEPSKDLLEKRDALSKAIRECPPDGSLWEVIAKHGWRRRGWFEAAYPGIGLGSVVPSDWCGFGCTLLGREALALADFDGYDWKGTEDLYVVWKRWHPAGIRINAIPHAPCDHVIWSKKRGGDEKEYTLVKAYHEANGECVGHLRISNHPWLEL